MTTIAKSKAQALVQPAKPLAVTPNVRQFNSPAAGAALSLSNEATNIVQVVNPASTLTINVDGQNFSAFGANHFVLHVDTTAATEITLNFVRGATVLATKSIEIEADQLAVLTFAAVIKANNAVTLLALGQHVVGKSEATDGNGAVGGLQLVNASYANGLLEHTGGQIAYFYSDAMSALIDFDASTTVRITVPSSSYTFSAVLSNSSDPATALDNALASVFAAENTMGLLIEGDLSEIGDIPRMDLSVAAGDLITFGQQNGNQISVLLNGQTYLSRIDPAINPSLPLYLYLFVTDNHSSSSPVPVIPMLITKEEA